MNSGYAGERRRVVIIGGGFGGAYAAQHLSRALPRPDWEVTLLDRNNFLLFYPLLVEAGVGNLEPRHVVVPIRKFMPRGDFRMAEVTEIDLDSQAVYYRVPTRDAVERLRFDHLILAPGSATKFPPVPGLREHGFELKSLSDSISLRDRGIRHLEIASSIADPAERAAYLRVVVVGSNFSGIEFAGEYQDFLVDLARSYPNLRRDEIRVTVVEYANRVLPALDEDLAAYARKQLERRGLEIRTNTTLTRVAAESCTLTTGETLPTRTVVWCAGIAPSPLLERVRGLPRNRFGYIECEPTLRVAGRENVWAVGDSATVLGPDGKPYAATAQNASRQGTVAAENVVATIRGRPTRAFAFNPVGSLAALGCRTAVAKVFGFKLSGFLAWFLYRTVYLMKMPSWGRRVRIVLDWTVELFFRRDIAQIGLAGGDSASGTGTNSPQRDMKVQGMNN